MCINQENIGNLRKKLTCSANFADIVSGKYCTNPVQSFVQNIQTFIIMKNFAFLNCLYIREAKRKKYIYCAQQISYERKILMKRMLKTFAAAAAVVTAMSAFAPAAGAYDDYTVSVDDYRYDEYYGSYPYYGGTLTASAQVYTVNPDKGDDLYFTVTNDTDEPAWFGGTENCFVQIFDGSGWVTVKGEENEIMPLYEPAATSRCYDSYYDEYYDDDISEYPFFPEEGEFIPPHSSLSDVMSVSDLEDGDYRLGFNTAGYSGTPFVYFRVQRNISAEVVSPFAGDSSLCIRVTNNMPVPIDIELDSSLIVLEQYKSGRWKEVPAYTGYMTSMRDDFYVPSLAAGQTDEFYILSDMFDELDAGRYRLTFCYTTPDYYADYPEAYSGSKTIKFTVNEPVELKVLPSSSKTASGMYITVKVTNNTEDYLSINNYGRISRYLGKRWYTVNLKKKSDGIYNYKRIRPNDDGTIRLNFSDYYNVKHIPAGKYRMEIPINGKIYYCNFTVSDGRYFTVK